VNRSTLVLAVALFAVAAVAAGLGATLAIREATAPTLRQPLLITACPPETFVGDDCTTGAPAPAVVELSEDLLLRVAGRVCSEETVAYQVAVSWVSVDTDAVFDVIDVPVTYDAGCNPPYGVPGSTFEGWRAPPQLVELAASAAPGDDLGRWRIVGTATPVRGDTYATYQWDSVKTFGLVKG